MRFYFQKKDLVKNYGLFYVLGIVVAIIALCYALLHNPYKDLHKNIFALADTTRTFYRDKPGYWKLSTASAKNDGLFAGISDFEGYDLNIGQGANGSTSMPSDMTFDIALNNLSKSACITLSEYPLADVQKLSLAKITIIAAGKETEFSWGTEHSLPIQKYGARNICAGKNNTLIWTFQ